MPGKNRRVHPRQRAVSLTYVDLGESNGGIVLNVSESGIGIQAVEMVEGPTTVRLQLPGSKKHLEVRTELAWVGPSRKEAGLCFVDLSEDTLKQIRNWIACEASPYAFGRHNGNFFFEPTPVPVSLALARVAIDETEPITRLESAASTEQVAAIQEPVGNAAGETELQLEALTQVEPDSSDSTAAAISEPAGTEEVTIVAETPAVDSTFDVEEAQDQIIEAAAFEALAMQGEADTSALPETISAEPDEVSAKTGDIRDPQAGTEAIKVHSDVKVTDPLAIQKTASSPAEGAADERAGALLAAPQLGKDQNAAGLEADTQDIPEIGNEQRSARDEATAPQIGTPSPSFQQAEDTELAQNESMIVQNQDRDTERDMQFRAIQTTELAQTESSGIDADDENRVAEARIPEPQPRFFEAPVETIATTRSKIPASASNQTNELRSVSSAALPSSASTAMRDFPTTPKTPLFVPPHILSQKPDDDPWKSFRVQTYGGWFVATIFILAAAISFVAGMAVRRGTLDEVTNRFGPPVPPATAPAHTPNQGSADAQSASAVIASSEPSSIAADAPAKSLDIEIVDSTGGRWTIPATVGSSHEVVSSASQAATQEFTATSQSAQGNRPVTTSQPSSISQPTSKALPSTTAAVSSPTPANAQSASTPLIVPLSETPISATGSVAIRSKGSITVSPGVTPPSPDGHNLRTGQLSNVVEPYYPPEAQQLHIEGMVKLHAVIGADGAVQSVDPVSGPDLLVRSAMSAVRQWKYTPTTLNSKPVATQQDITFVFRLPN
ncbi:MAG: TonB family protein [Candidatus Acidiferrales bacterium]